MIDKKGPAISILSPANVTYNLGQLVVANYACADGGAGLQSCTAMLDNRPLVDLLHLGTTLLPVDTLRLGQHTFTVKATDSLGNTAQQSVAYTVARSGAGGTPTADLSVTMSAPPVVTAGQSLTFTIRVTNQGPSSVSHAYLYNLSIPQGTTFVSAQTTQGALNVPAAGSPTGVISGDLGELNRGGTATITLVVNVTSPTSVREIIGGAGVSANVFDPVVANNVAATSTRIR